MSDSPTNEGLTSRLKRTLSESVLTPQAVTMALQGAVQRFYANSIALAQSPTDLSIVFVHNNQPISTVSLSYETAKILCEAISQAISAFERAAGYQVGGTELVDKLKRVTEEREQS